MFDQVLHDWRKAADKFQNIVDGVPHDLRTKPGVCGEWNCQQVIAHLAGWQREAFRRFEIFRTGDYTSITYDEDAFNADSVEALKLLGWSDVVDTFRFTCDDLEKISKLLSSDEIEANSMYAEWLTSLTRELQNHGKEIEEWLVMQAANNS